MSWLACELHTHTFHSDGKQSLQELAAGAKSLGFDCIALTDHNTMTGLADKEEVERATGISIIPGMEWTTFFGHMVTIGLDRYVDWRPVGPGDLHAGLAKVHDQGGIAGMAHPFRPGSPMCTGCYWEFEVSDWNDIDYIEVWSTTFAPLKNNNARAYRFWTDKLNEGFRLAATSGRDWHHQEPTDEPLSVTYLHLEDSDAPLRDRAIRALSSGRASVTLGPRLDLQISRDGRSFGIGDIVPRFDSSRQPNDQRDAPVLSSSGFFPDLPSRVQVRAAADFAARSGHWELPEQTFTIKLDSNTGVLFEGSLDRDKPLTTAEISPNQLTWLRAELWGIIRGVRTLIAFTNAVYFE
ncbi:histidinol-phosphatase [Paenibacillus yonginensis]|uniref:Histidinol-phosphatase n=1 Tax=Paenibacillus yonginensis TaxID=1462996 RepID=A0A1B1MXK1_9BACL|nr:CehA/McbA family metallohydrolase [Paenibacillus yonginensis]ANS73904.1 histidinol-phosphatase [Paenibacillus yonginensis]